MLTSLVIGVFQGATYGLLAVGLVLVYKGTRVFNFMQGEFGTVAAYATWGLVANAHVPYGFAVLAGLACAVLLGLVVERLVIRPLLDSPKITLLVATVGAALLTISLTTLFGKSEGRVLAPALGSKNFFILGAGVATQQLLLVAVLAGLAVALAYFFSRTDLGLAVLATSQDAFATRVVGISVPAMSRFIWGFAALLGGIAGILQAPIGVFGPGFMTGLFIVPAFTAAVLGGMTSLPGAFLGGELVGVAQSLGIYYLERFHIPGTADLTVFALLLAVLLVRPQGLLGKEA
ncbi:MAG: branched-chain amino acid ABC transporter permease [Acidobacteria bacterium]|nr:branched-chain amino acid ABC transporter permease [Acidobacteriota bacterium]